MSVRPAGPARGQVLLLVAFGVVVLIGVAALAIDLGFSWMLRRQEQNAADPAALAAARFISDPDPVTGLQSFDATPGSPGFNAACHYVRANGFFSSANTACDASLESGGTRMVVNYPPDSSAGDFSGQPGMVQVIVWAEHDSFFGRIFGETRATVTTGAVAARQRGNTNSNSLVALKRDGCSTALVRGNSTITIFPAPGYTGDGGYVQVNSDCAQGTSTVDDDCSTSGEAALKINGGAVLIAPKVNVYGACKGDINQPQGTLNEAARQLGDPLGGLRFPPWDTSLAGAKCGITSAATTAIGAQGCGQGGGRIPWAPSADSACPGMNPSWDCIELDPGVYYGGWLIGAKTNVTLKPGIYIIAGGGITIGSSGALDSLAGGASPAPILIHNTDNPRYADSCPGAGVKKCQADIDLTAQASLKIASLLADQPCPPVTTTGGCPFGGMVIWYDKLGSQSDTYSGQVDIEGGSNLFISGTIYAPTAHVDITGNVQTNCPSGVQTAAVQIISWTWDIGGTGDLCMPYDPSKLYKLTSQGLVH